MSLFHITTPYVNYDLLLLQGTLAVTQDEQQIHRPCEVHGGLHSRQIIIPPPQGPWLSKSELRSSFPLSERVTRPKTRAGFQAASHVTAR